MSEAVGVGEEELDIDEGAVLGAFDRNLVLHLDEADVVTRSFAMPEPARQALDRLLERGVLVSDHGDPPLYRRSQDTLRGLLRQHLVRTAALVVIGAVLGLVLSWTGLFDAPLYQLPLMFLVIGLLPLVPLWWRERGYARRRR